MTALGRGTRVKCVNRDGLWPCPEGVQYAGPAFGSVWTVSKFIRSYFEYRGPWLALAGWPDNSWFKGEWFVPLSGNEDLADLEAAFKKGLADAERLPRVRVVEKVR